MTDLLHRTIHNTLPVAVSGNGMTIYDQTGKAYLDASGGAAVSCLGHGHPAVLKAIREQLDAIAYAHTGFFTTEVAERLAERLVGDAPEGLEKVFLVSGGSEAVESALKMARQYFIEIGQPERRHVIARRQSYHGATLGALAAGGNEWRRAQFDPLLPEAHHISPCYAYRHQRDGETLEAYGQRAAAELEEKILELGAGQVMAFLAEPVVGATSGAVAPAPGYFQAVRDICDRHGVLLIFDEVMCGMGRTGTLYACEQENVTPDLLTIAKGLGGGYQPIGAVLLSGDIFGAFEQGSGFFQHAHTYMGHPTAAAAALAVQDVIQHEDLLDNVVAMGAHLSDGLSKRFGQNAHVGDIRGRGLLQAIELVENRETKAPFEPAIKLHARIKKEAMARGLMVYPMGGTIDGRAGDHVLIAPPFIATKEDIETIVDRLGRAVEAALDTAH